MEQLTTSKNSLKLGTLVKDYVAYNAWANQTLIAWLKTKPSEVIDQLVPSSFPSIKETLIHIWDTERFWLSVVEQTPTPISFRHVQFEGSVQEVFDNLEKCSEAFSSFVNSLSESSIQEYVSFYTPYVEGTRSRFEFIHHAMNHSTYHRGQLITIGRNLGLTDAPMTDYNFYLMMVKAI